MHVQVNTGTHIEDCEALATRVRSTVESVLGRVSDHITRVEVHLSDESGQKGRQDDKRCMMEARLQGRQPVAVTHEAATLEEAIDGAADKLARLVASSLGRLHDKRGHAIDLISPEPKPTEPS